MVARARWGISLLAVAVVVLQACQPVDEVDVVGGEDDAEEADAGERPAGLDGLTEAAGPVAREWDPGATLVEVAVALDDEGAWREATATFVAPDADRMLLVNLAGDGTTEQEPTLETFGFTPVPAAALEEVPELPDTAVAPEEAAVEADAAFDDCGLEGGPREVLYSSGAPGAWDGSAWAPAPSWSVSVLGQGGGVRLALDGTAREDPCFEVP